MARGLGKTGRSGMAVKLLLFRCDEDNLAGLHEFQFFAGESFDGGGIGSKRLNFGGEVFVFGIEFGDFGFDGGELLGLGVNFKSAFIVEHGKQEHRDREEAEYAKSDSNDRTLHQASVIHCLPYSKSLSRSAVDVDSA